MGKVVIVGSINTDMILAVDQLPKLGETVLGGEFTSAGGGKGANQAVAAARAGAQVTFVAKVGYDPLGNESIARFQAEGIDTTHISRDSGASTGVALIFVDAAGENCIGVASGANAKLSTADIDTARDVIASASVLLVQLETPLETVARAIDLAHAAGVRVLLNPAPARTLPDALLGRVSIITPNRGETELLTGVKMGDAASLAEAVRALHARGVSQAILTLGSAGVYVSEGAAAYELPAHKVEPVDTTAAGDVFSGALAAALSEDRALRDAVAFANAAAALSVQRMGAQPSVPMRTDIEAFMTKC